MHNRDLDFQHLINRTQELITLTAKEIVRVQSIIQSDKETIARMKNLLDEIKQDLAKFDARLAFVINRLKRFHFKCQENDILPINFFSILLMWTLYYYQY